MYRTQYVKKIVYSDKIRMYLPWIMGLFILKFLYHLEGLALESIRAEGENANGFMALVSYGMTGRDGDRGT